VATIGSAGLLSVLMAFAFAQGHTIGVLIGVGLLAFAACFWIPLQWLPPIALVSALILPAEVLKWPITLLPAAAWLVRAPRSRAGRGASRSWAVALGAWILLSEAFAPLHSRAGYIWVVCALLGIIAPVVLTPILDAQVLKRTFLVLVTWLGAYAVVEKFVLKANPLYGSLYASGGDPIIQGSPYRATTLLGHPLVNGLVFATAAVLAVDRALDRDASRWSYLRVLVILAGLAATLSRGSTVAAALAIVALVLVRQARTTSFWRRLGVGVVMALGAVVFAGPLISRNDTSGAQKSAADRGTLISDTLQVLRGHAIVGVGPGTVQLYRLRYGLLDVNLTAGPSADTALESTYAELAAGLGIPGLVLFLTLIAAVILTAVRRGRPGEALALLTFTVALGTFKTEGHVQLFIVLGLLMSLALSERESDGDARELTFEPPHPLSSIWSPNVGSTPALDDEPTVSLGRLRIDRA
jgi:hypothetical protein